MILAPSGVGPESVRSVRIAHQIGGVGELVETLDRTEPAGEVLGRRLGVHVPFVAHRRRFRRLDRVVGRTLRQR